MSDRDESAAVLLHGMTTELALGKQTLTLKQHALLEFVDSYITEHQHSPLIREIQAGCRITSYKSVVDRLNALERKGLIQRVSNKHRGITLLNRPLMSLPLVAAPDLVMASAAPRAVESR